MPRGPSTLTLAALFLAAPAAAQDGFDAHNFQLAAQDGDARDLLSMQRPGRMTAGDFYAAGLVEYAESPLLVMTRFPDDSRSDQIDAALDTVVALNLVGGFVLHERVRLDVGAPVYFLSTGTGGEMLPAGFGDVRLGGLLALVVPERGDGGGGFGLGLSPWLDIPTGDASTFRGQRTFAGGAAVDGTYELSTLTLSGRLGVQLNPEIDLNNFTGSDQLVVGVGGSTLVTDTVGAGLELRYLPALSASSEPGTASPAELLASVRGRTGSGASWLAGGAAGLTPAAGTPVFRLFVGGGFGRVADISVPPPLDTDKDGFLDTDDQCPDKPEKVNQYKDDDGCPDNLAKVQITAILDERPTAAVPVILKCEEADPISVETQISPVMIEVVPGFCSVQGALAGYVGEQDVHLEEGLNAIVLDLVPTVPSQVRVVAEDAAGNRVPNARVTFRGYRATDQVWTTDNQGVVELEHVAGQFDTFVVADALGVYRESLRLTPGESHEIRAVLEGERVKVTAQKIEILDKVFFEFEKATIENASFRVLDQVAGVLLDNPQIEYLEVAGHTDDVGTADFNLELSMARAQAVVDYLVKAGVEEQRLVAKGYGMSQPLAPNTTDDGRAKNRRVEFVILERR